LKKEKKRHTTRKTGSRHKREKKSKERPKNNLYTKK